QHDPEGEEDRVVERHQPRLHQERAALRHRGRETRPREGEREARGAANCRPCHVRHPHPPLSLSVRVARLNRSSATALATMSQTTSHASNSSVPNTGSARTTEAGPVISAGKGVAFAMRITMLG